ncbi:hypothetical protein JCM1840_001628 [Sporobolomyces johnsonii]
MLYATGSYILYPAYYCSSTIRSALGYFAPPPTPNLAASNVNSTSDPSFQRADVAWTITKEDEDRVRAALVESMLDWEAEQSGSVLEDDEKDLKSTEENAPEGIEAERRPTEEGVGIEDAPSQLDDPPASALSSSIHHRDPVDDVQAEEEAADVTMAASTSLRQLRPAPAPASAARALNEPQRRRPLSTLSLFSRRASVCLSAAALTLESSETEALAAAAAKDGGGVQCHHAQEEEPSGRERELVERVFGEEARRVEREVERAVESDRGVAVPEADEAGEVVVEGATYFRDGRAKSFADIDFSAGVDTEGFCDACEGLVGLAGKCSQPRFAAANDTDQDTGYTSELVAPAAASLCAGDVMADINRIRTRLKTHPTHSATLEQLVGHERKERRRPATESLGWLILVLKFGAAAYRLNLDSPTKEELGVSFTRAWDAEYHKYFNWLVKPLFKKNA